jgi:predicted permease
MRSLVADLVHSVRSFLRTPSFTLAALAALTLGIGANTAVFSVVNAVLLKPPPVPEPDRVVMFMNTSPQGSNFGASPAKFAFWSRQDAVIQDAAAFRTNIVNYTGGGAPEQLRSGQVSAGYFRLFGAPMALGRTFLPEEDRPGGRRVVVLSHGLWARRFASDPSVIGRTLELSGIPYTVVGIVGQRFDVSEFDSGGPPPELWVPFQLDPETRDQGHYFVSAGRLRPGVSLSQAQARFQVAAADFRAAFPNELRPEQGFTVTPLRDAFVQNVSSSLWILLGAVGFVLLIACANVANLLLVRATTRRREFAIRAALGAGRRRLVRQLLTESVLLSAIGGALGLGGGIVGIRALLAVNTADLPRLGQNASLVGLDWRVVAFTVGISLATGLIFGLVPAIHASRTDLSAVLKDSGGPGGSAARHNRTRSALVVLEVGLAIVLLIGSALLVRTSMALGAVDPGYDTHNVLTMRMSLGGPQFVTAASVDQLVRDGVTRLLAVPGVEQASSSCCVPLQGGYGLPFLIVGRPLADRPFHGGGAWRTVSAGYFEVFRIPVKRGRVFTDRDVSGSPPVVVINEAMAKQYWKDADPLDDRLVIGRGIMREFADEPERQIVGIVGDTRDGALNRNPPPQMFIPQAQVPDAANALNMGINPLSWVVRTRVPPQSVRGPVQEQLRQLTGLPVSDVLTMDEVVARSTSRQRLNTLLMLIFGGVALLLAAVGVYGLVAYSVEQRRHELGIRLALGAPATRLRNMVVLEGVRLAVAGVVLGLVGAYGVTRLISSLLFGVEAQDPVVFAVISIVLAAVVLVATWVPAGQASRVDPMVALRGE